MTLVLRAPLPNGRARVTAEGASRDLGALISDLRQRCYRRVERAPRRVREFSAESIDPAAHTYRLEWIEPRPARRARAAVA